MLKQVCTLILSLFISLEHGTAQELVQRDYRTQQGLSSNEVYDVISDSKGYLWFATNRGVCKFDGNNFKHFNLENGLKDQVILGLTEDSQSHIWCRSISGKISYIENDVAQTIEARTKSYYPNSLFVDYSGNLRIGSQTSGVFYRVESPYRSENMLIEVDTLFDLHISKSKNGLMYSRSTKNNGRSIFINEDTGEKTEFQIRPSASDSKVIMDENIIMVCSDNYLYIIDEQNQFAEYTLPFTVKNAFRDASKNLWLCLGPDQGAALYENTDMTKSPKLFMKNATITSIAQDFEGGYWFGTLNDGVKYVSTLQTLAFDISAIAKGSNHTILRAGDELLFANSLGGILHILASSASSIGSKNFLEHPNSLPSEVKLVVKNKKMIEYNNGISREVMPSPDYHYLRETKDLITPSDKPFYWGTSTLTCFKVDKKNNSILETYIAPSRINGTCVMDNSSFFLSCTDGLWTFSDGQFTEISASIPKLKHRLNDVQIDEHNSLWIASGSAGVFILDKDSLVQLRREDGLTSNSCNNILIEGDSIYVATDNGISLIANYGTPQFKISPLTTKQGLPGKLIKSTYKIHNRFYFHSDEGLFTYDPEEPSNDLSAPKIYLTSLKANGKEISPNGELNFPHDQNNISISVTGLSFKNPEENYYKYKLEGIDEEWNISSTGQIQYPSLSPGAYTFRVYAVNASDVESLDAATISFTIIQPYWQTWWFIFFCALLFLALTFWIATHRIRQIKRRAKEQELINAKIAKTEMRALQAQMNPHFIFNCINSIQHHILEQDKLVANKLLSKFAKLVRNVLENSNSEWISIHKEIETLELYIEMESVRFDSKFTYSIEVAKDINTHLENIPPLIIQPFVENAIIHGLLPLENKQGILAIRLFKKEGKLICSIDDNGIGREQARQIKATKETNYQSMGISLTQERLNIYQSGKHHRNMELNISDKLEGIKSAGTVVQIQLPIKAINT
jgi:ligand-binding sensor domain-containing protein